MQKETSCLECRNIFPNYKMVLSAKTNSYGDKTEKGYICYSCYAKRVKHRSSILLIPALGLLGLSLILFTIAIWIFVFSRGFTRIDAEFLSEIYLFWGVLMGIFGTFLLYIRRKEIHKVKNLLKKQ